MVLNEAPSEEFQHTWYARLAQERRELSASVEQALVDTPRQESFLLDDQGQHTSIVRTGERRHVFPPRLSLQSRPLPTTSSRVGVGLISAASSRVEHTSIWMRLVNCLRSSLALFRLHSSPALSPITDGNMSVKASAYDAGKCDRDVKSKNADDDKLQIAEHELSEDGEDRFEIDGNDGDELMRSVQGRQRLAGRTTRVRLEVVPDVATFGDKDGTSVCLRAIEKIAKQSVDNDGGTTSIRLPVVEKGAKGQEEPLPTRRVGTGVFECGQRDVTISDTAVSASSVVLVMLTINPGPVVVQYVSLLPRVGFTVHLTAPATTAARFNYVILG